MKKSKFTDLKAKGLVTCESEIWVQNRDYKGDVEVVKTTSFRTPLIVPVQFGKETKPLVVSATWRLSKLPAEFDCYLGDDLFAEHPGIMIAQGQRCLKWDPDYTPPIEEFGPDSTLAAACLSETDIYGFRRRLIGATIRS